MSRPPNAEDILYGHLRKYIYVCVHSIIWYELWCSPSQNKFDNHCTSVFINIYNLYLLMRKPSSTSQRVLRVLAFFFLSFFSFFFLLYRSGVLRMQKLRTPLVGAKGYQSRNIALHNMLCLLPGPLAYSFLSFRFIPLHFLRNLSKLRL